MRKHNGIRRFLFPSFNRNYIIRLLLVAVSAYLLFAHAFIPFKIRGRSMEPTYMDGGLNFCQRLKYLFSEPMRYDVVAVRFAGKKVMLLKRVVALAGETVEFRQGKLFIDGNEIREDYIQYPCNWDLPPRRVENGRVYVVGDNRDIAIERHDFGQTSISRIMGTPLW